MARYAWPAAGSIPLARDLWYRPRRMDRLPDEILCAIGDEVRRRREALGYSLQDLADRAKLSRNYVCNVELGKADFSISVLWSIATGLGCEVTELFPSAKHPITPEVLAAARMLAGAEPAVLDAVMALLGRIPSSRRKLRSRTRG